MGIIEFFTGWKYVGNTLNRTIEADGKHYLDMRKLINRISPKIIKKLEKKADKKQQKYLDRWLRKNKGHAPLGRTVRGYKITPDIPSVTVYTKGKHFMYKGKDSSSRYHDNHGHGGYLGGGMKIWRKPRKVER